MPTLRFHCLYDACPDAALAQAPACRPPAGSGRNEEAGMSDMASTCRYEIRVDGVLDSRWETWFEGLHIASDDRHTTISGPSGRSGRPARSTDQDTRPGDTPVVRPTPRPGLILGQRTPPHLHPCVEPTGRRVSQGTPRFGPTARDEREEQRQRRPALTIATGTAPGCVRWLHRSEGRRRGSLSRSRPHHPPRTTLALSCRRAARRRFHPPSPLSSDDGPAPLVLVSLINPN